MHNRAYIYSKCIIKALKNDNITKIFFVNTCELAEIDISFGLICDFK